MESFKNIKPVVKVAQAQPDVQLLVSDIEDTRMIGAVGPPMSQQMRGTSEELLQAVLARLDCLESSLPKPREGQPQRREQRPPRNGQQIVMLVEQDTTQDPSQERSSAGSVEKKDTMLEDVQSRHPHANHRETNSLNAKGWVSEGQPIQAQPDCKPVFGESSTSLPTGRDNQ